MNKNFKRPVREEISSTHFEGDITQCRSQSSKVRFSTIGKAKQIIGKKQTEITPDFFTKAKKYKKTILDLGCGHGEWIYARAKANPDHFHIGIDPAGDSLIKTSLRTNKKPAKGGLENLIYIVAAAETLPLDFSNFFDEIFILFPWGKLLFAMIEPHDDILAEITRVAKQNARFTLVTTYDKDLEDKSVGKSDLPDLTRELFRKTLAPKFKTFGINFENIEELLDEGANNFDTAWRKTIFAGGKTRTVFKIAGIIEK